MWETIFTLLLLIGVVGLIVANRRAKSAQTTLQEEKSALARQLEEISNNLKRGESECAELRQRLLTLEKYQPIVVVEDEVSRLREEGDKIINEAKVSAGKILGLANDKLFDAEKKSEALIKQAEQKAVEIAGEALSVKEDAEKWAAMATAMRNAVKGYGDEYLVPSRSVLDDLAEEYGYSQAAEDLKRAREKTKSLLKAGKAADCDYVESYRRETAIGFVVDAFNGKVDSILSRVKTDNFGKLSKQIKDAFGLVNGHGRAFRNARILDEYLQSRLDELKWAVAVKELQAIEKEEQRRIAEQIREEAKVQREIERALKEAAREEKLVQEAMEKARQRLEAASDAEREKFQAQLAALESRLHEAEAKNQRALSMAQQTKAGHVYIISNIGSLGENVYKIGMTRRLEPLDRVSELGDASVPFAFDVHAMIWADDAPKLERDLHKRFLLEQVNKVNYRKEFFHLPLEDIKRTIEGLKIETKWTLVAQAAEYRETKAIEMSFQDPKKKAQWLEEQGALDPVSPLIFQEELAEV